MNAWLDAHGERLLARFDATSYTTLLDAMDAHEVGRNRGGVVAALGSIAHRLTGVGIPGDLLYPAETVREWTSAIGAHYVDLPSIHGHDAFLLETTKVSDIVRTAIARAEGEHAVAPLLAPSATPVARVRFRHALAPTRIALAGCGHVGGSVLELLTEGRASGRAVRVDRVLVRDPRLRSPLERAIAHGTAPVGALVTDPSQLLDERTDVLIEAIGGTTTARTLVEAALKRGIRVITANKALLAERGPQLQALAHANGARLDFEGAVAAAIPVIRCIRSGAVGVGVSECSGILNGTSNFVLDRIAEGRSLTDAIAEARQLGYAEADPSRDLSGEDAEDKLRVLAWLLFGIDPKNLPVVRRGIDAEAASWAAQVAREGDRVKLVATCSLTEGHLTARVAPTRVAANDPWAQVSGPGNRIVITSASAGTLVFNGAGAGGRATAGAVLGDLWS
jgi:homoserine dehydrogenase